MVEETVFQPATGIDWNGHTGMVKYGGGDQNMLALFYTRPVHHPAKSLESGTPIYVDTPYIKIHPPGERWNIIDRPANDSDKRRWPMQWQQYLQNKQQVPNGTPIDLLYVEAPAIAAALRANGVHTIEQCAGLSASAIENIGMGAQRYSNDAKMWLDNSKKGVGQSQMRHELAERDRQIKILSRQVEEQGEIIARLQQAGTGAASLEQVQAIIAGALARPTHLPNRQFDSQIGMINSTNAATRVPEAKPKRRVRAKLGG